jgi:voltage-dependent potassium channel beta subunit
MEYRFLGQSGLKISALSLGSWVTFGGQVGEEVAYECMTAAYDAGVNFFDNAESYEKGEAETVMGNVVRRTGWKRSDLVIATKIFWGGPGPNDVGLSRKHVVEGTLASLKRLDMDYVDLIFCHRPDSTTPIEETVRAMNHVIDRGWAFYWGTSEWSAQQIMEAHQIAAREHLIAPLMEQPHYNMFNRERFERDYARLYSEFGMGTTIWSPLASGLLTGKYNDGIPDDSRAALEGYEWLRSRFESDEIQNDVKKVKKLGSLAADLGGSVAQLALAWCLKNPNVSSVITGASRQSQVVENMKALELSEKLNDEVMAEIETILDNKPAADMRFRS